MKMPRIFVIFWVLLLTSSTLLAVPLYSPHKRQSDQRIAELETLLAMHKYGVGQPRRVGGRNSAGYGLIDFNYIGRRKKSTRTGRDDGHGMTFSSPSGGAGRLLEDLHLSSNDRARGALHQPKHFRITGTAVASLLHQIEQGQRNMSGQNGLSPPQLPPPLSESFRQGQSSQLQLSPTHKDWVVQN